MGELGQSGRAAAPTGAGATRRDRDRTLEAMHALEEATARPATGEQWAHGIQGALEQLEAALGEQRASYEDPLGLLAEIALDDPRLRTLVRQLQHRWVELQAAACELAQALGAPAGSDAAEVRDSVRWLMGAIRHHRERESDLVFAAVGLDLAES
jgi:hypothetical protein